MKKLVILTVLVSIFSISAIAATYCYGYDYSRGSNNYYYDSYYNGENRGCCHSGSRWY